MTMAIDTTGWDTQTIAAVVAAIIAFCALVVAIVAWRWPRGIESPEARRVIRLLTDVVSGMMQPTNIQAANGVPSLEQLLAGIDLDSDGMRVAESLYESGLEQFNHYLNNLDGVVAEAQSAMNTLKEELTDIELYLAKEVGIGLASAQEEERLRAVSKYDNSAPNVQIYAMHRRNERRAKLIIADALRRNVPRTDFTAVKNQIASGEVSLSAIVSELPCTWQDVTSMGQTVAFREPDGKPPNPEYVHALFITGDEGILEDKRAERDGKWIVSQRHDITAPYRQPVRQLTWKDPNRGAVPTGRYVSLVTPHLTSAEDIEFWRKGGYGDSIYQRTKDGTLPWRWRRSYRRRQIKKLGWVITSVLFVADVVLVTYWLLNSLNVLA